MRKPLLLLLVLLAGCGGDDEPASTTTPLPVTDTVTVPASTGTVATAPVTTPEQTTSTEDSGGTAAEEEDSGGAAAEDETETEVSGGTTSPANPKRKPQPSAEREVAAAYFAPRAGTTRDTFTLYASGFRPGAELTVLLSRPDGQNVRAGTLTAGSDGSGKLALPQSQTSAEGRYNAVVKNSATGASATAELLVVG